MKFWTNMRWYSGQIDMKFWTNMRWKADKYKMKLQCEDWSPVAVSSVGRGRNTKPKPTPSLSTCFLLLFHFPTLFTSRNTPQPVGDRGDHISLLFRFVSISFGCCTCTANTMKRHKSLGLLLSVKIKKCDWSVSDWLTLSQWQGHPLSCLWTLDS